MPKQTLTQRVDAMEGNIAAILAAVQGNAQPAQTDDAPKQTDRTAQTRNRTNAVRRNLDPAYIVVTDDGADVVTAPFNAVPENAVLVVAPQSKSGTMYKAPRLTGCANGRVQSSVGPDGIRVMTEYPEVIADAQSIVSDRAFPQS